MVERLTKLRARLAACVLVLTFALQCVWFARANGQTYDEALTIVSGVLLLRGGPDINGEHPPLARVLSALPVEVVLAPPIDFAGWQTRRAGGFEMGRLFLYESGLSHERVLHLARAPSIALAVATVLLIGLFAHRLWGPRAGLLALALAAFDPNLVAHGSLASHDGPLTFFTIAACFCASELLRAPGVRWLVAMGIALGCAAVTKFSGVAIAFAVGAGLLAQAAFVGGVPAVWLGSDSEPSRDRSRALLHALVNVALILGVALLVVRLTYRGGAYAAYVAGVRAQLAHQAAGHPAYFMGELSRTGWPAYFPVALLVKSPPLTVALLTLSLVLFRRGAPFGRSTFTVLMPALALLVSLLFARVAIGVRYALPIVPLLIVAASRVATMDLRRVAIVSLAVGLLHHGIAALRVAPHQIAFFSDAIGGPARGAKIVADSNLDWGQDLPALAAWQRSHPGELWLSYFGSADITAHGITYRAAPNACPHPAPASRDMAASARNEKVWLAVSAMNELGVFFGDVSVYRWLEGRAPVARLGHSIGIWDLTHDADGLRQLAALCTRFGPPAAALDLETRAQAAERSRR